MRCPAFWPHPRYVKHIDLEGARFLATLCTDAGVRCKASGNWVLREVTTRIADDPTDEGSITIGVDDHNAVEIVVPQRYATSPRTIARYALCAMAYGIFDVVARESVRGQPWAQMEPPPRRRQRGTAVRSNRARRRAVITDDTSASEASG